MKDYSTAVRASNTRDAVDLFRKYLRPYSGWVWLLVISYFILSLLTAVQPLVMAPMLDIVTGDLAGEPLPPPESLVDVDLNNLGLYLIQWLQSFEFSEWDIVWVMAITYLLISVLLYVVQFGVYMLSIWIRVHSERDIQKDLFRHLLSLSMEFFNRKRTGELISRMDQDTRATVYNLATIAQNTVVSLVLTFFYGFLLFRTNPRLTFFIAIAGVLHYGLTQAIRNPIKARVRDQFNVMAETTAYLQEVITSIRVVKSFAAEKYEHSRLADLIRKILAVNIRFGVFKKVEEPIGNAINSLANVAILLMATAELFGGGLTTAGFFLYLYIGRSVLDPITNLARTYTMLQATVATSERVYDLFNERVVVSEGSRNAEPLRKQIEFEGVSFRYQEEVVLEDVNLVFKRGQMIALVGPSGAGKSTLTDLLLRLYDPTEGRIRIDGVDLREFDSMSYRRMFGVVSQESQLFNDTVANNIGYPGLELDEEKIEAAAKVANAHEFITQLPQGYQTLIGDRGVLLSGGQRQRVAIARAVVRDPQILILDEATSSLDSESEKLVQEAIDRVVQDTTAIIIAHRLSTVRNADKIVVIEGGVIVDQGDHEELLERCQLYQRLCNLQFMAPAEDRTPISEG